MITGNTLDTSDLNLKIKIIKFTKLNKDSVQIVYAYKYDICVYKHILNYFVEKIFSYLY